MKNYYRVALGSKGKYAESCLKGNFIGVDFEINQNLTYKLPEEWQAFNREFIPLYLKAHPKKSKIAAGLACGALWTVAKGIKTGDIVLCPDSAGRYQAGEIEGDYYYDPGEMLPHRRPVNWLNITIDKADMSEALRRTTESFTAVVNYTHHAEEIEKLLTGISGQEVEDYSEFVLEKHLEDFLVQNWTRTELGAKYNIYEENGEKGQQYNTDTGPLDILAISKDKKTLLVIELKKGRASDAVVGQILRYMSYVQEMLAEDSQIVKGIIIAHRDDQKIRRALSLVNDVEFYRYNISFKLVKS